MNKLFRAIRAENRKLWYKKSSLLWLIITALIAAFVSFVCSSAIDYVNFSADLWPASDHFSPSITQTVSEAGWEADANRIIEDSYAYWEELADMADNGTYMQRAIAHREREIAARESLIASYRLENGLSPEGGGMWRMMQYIMWLMMPLICVISIVAASDMFAGEYTRSTIHMNLARPVTRIKQYTAKLITAWFYGTLLTICAFVGCALTSAVLLGDTGGAYVGLLGTEVYEKSWPMHFLDVSLCCLASVILSITLCACMGSMTRSRAVSAVGTMAIVGTAVWLGRFIAPTLGIVSGLSIFACFDLTLPLMSSAGYYELSFADCCVSCTVHFVIMLIAGYSFMKRDITN